MPLRVFRAMLIVIIASLLPVGCGPKTIPTEASIPATTSATSTIPEPTKPIPTKATSSTATTTPATQPAPVAVKPEEPKKASPLGMKIVTVDLSQYGLRATIDVPEGGIFVKKSNGVVIQYGEKNPYDNERREFDLKVVSLLDAFKSFKKGEKDDSRIVTIADTEDSFFYEYMDGTSVHCQFGRSIPTGDWECVVSGRILFSQQEPIRSQKKAVVDALWKAVQTLRQSDAQKKQEELRTLALKKLQMAKVLVYTGDTGVSVSFIDDNTTEGNILAVKDIPDMGRLEFRDPPADIQPNLMKLATAIPHIKQLSFEGEWFGDKQLDAIIGKPQYIALRFAKAKVTDKAFEKLAKNDAIKELWITETEATDAIIPTVQGMKNLKDLVLMKTKLTEGAIEKLKAARPDLKVHFSK